MIDGSKLLVVLCSRLLVLYLRRHGRNALPPHSDTFRCHRTASDAAWAVVAGTIDVGVVDGAVIDANVGDVYVVDGTVVVEPISAPVTTLVARADIPVAVVNTAVVANVLAPGSVVVAIQTCHESPISGGPQEADLRWPSPSARNPVVALRSVAPVSGRPQITIPGARWLRILRQRWRGLLCLKHWLTIARILVAGIGLGIGIGLVL